MRPHQQKHGGRGRRAGMTCQMDSRSPPVIPGDGSGEHSHSRPSADRHPRSVKMVLVIPLLDEEGPGVAEGSS
jgi:hypothetical protein